MDGCEEDISPPDVRNSSSPGLSCSASAHVPLGDRMCIQTRLVLYVALVLASELPCHQGVAGGTPWNAMGFLNVYWAALGFGNEEVRL